MMDIVNATTGQDQLAAQNGRHQRAHDDWRMPKVSKRKVKRIVTRRLRFCTTCAVSNIYTTINNK
jgi:hypothetical protein